MLLKRVVVVTVVDDIPLQGVGVDRADRWIMPELIYRAIDCLFASEEKLERNWEVTDATKTRS